VFGRIFNGFEQPYSAIFFTKISGTFQKILQRFFKKFSENFHGIAKVQNIFRNLILNGSKAKKPKYIK
jgi:hypothetical protein